MVTYESLALVWRRPPVLKVHRILSRALKVALQRGKVARNVCSLVDAPSVQQPEIQPLSAEEARKVLSAAVGKRNAARWSVALALGLRQGEALGLPWAAVDLDVGTLTVRQALQRQAGRGLVIVEPKSRKARRTIMLPRPLLEALQAHRLEQLAERLAAGSMWSEHGLVFVQVTGRPIDPSADNRAWRMLLADAGVRPARLHDARHTAATLLLQQGVPARVVMELLGHSQSASRWTRTAMSFRSSRARRRTEWRPHCGASGHHGGTVGRNDH